MQINPMSILATISDILLTQVENGAESISMAVQSFFAGN